MLYVDPMTKCKTILLVSYEAKRGCWQHWQVYSEQDPQFGSQYQPLLSRASKYWHNKIRPRLNVQEMYILRRGNYE